MSFLSSISQALTGAQNTDRQLEFSEAQRRREAEFAARKQAKENHERSVFGELLTTLRNIPEGMSTFDFTKLAEAVFSSALFDANAQEVLRAAIMADPTKFFNVAIRHYVAKHKDEEIGVLYVNRFFEIPATTEDIPKGHATSWAAQSAMAVFAAGVDIAMESKDQAAVRTAKEEMAAFCSLVLNRFPKMPVDFYNLLTQVERTGILYDKTNDTRKPSIPTAAQGAQEKNAGHTNGKRQFSKPHDRRLPDSKYAAPGEATPQEIANYQSKVPPASAPIAANPEAAAILAAALEKGDDVVPVKSARRRKANGHPPVPTAVASAVHANA